MRNCETCAHRTQWIQRGGGQGQTCGNESYLARCKAIKDFPCWARGARLVNYQDFITAVVRYGDFEHSTVTDDCPAWAPREGEK